MKQLDLFLKNIIQMILIGKIVVVNVFEIHERRMNAIVHSDPVAVKQDNA